MGSDKRSRIKFGHESSSPFVLKSENGMPSKGEGRGDGVDVDSAGFSLLEDSAVLVADLPVCFPKLVLLGSLEDSVPPESSFSGRGSRLTRPTSLVKSVIWISKSAGSAVCRRSSAARVKLGMDAESTVAGLGAWARACTEDIRAAMRIDFLNWDDLWRRPAETALRLGCGEYIVLGDCVYV